MLEVSKIFSTKVNCVAHVYVDSPEIFTDFQFRNLKRFYLIIGYANSHGLVAVA